MVITKIKGGKQIQYVFIFAYEQFVKIRNMKKNVFNRFAIISALSSVHLKL